MRSVRDTADSAHGRYSAARAELLRAVAELDSSGAWKGDGAGNLPAWLAARWQVSHATARELVRESQALVARPALEAALGRGTISVDQCKALMVLSEEGTEDAEVWLETLPFWSLPELQREARRQVARELERRDGGVYFRMTHTPDQRFMRGEFKLHPEDGAVLQAAIDARVPQSTPLRNWDRAGARALVELAAGEGSKPTVLLSVDAASLGGNGDTVARLGSGGYVGIETARRLGCDATMQLLYKNEQDAIIGTERASRSIPAWLRRAVEERDGGICTFPGCEREHYLQCHHIIHVVDGGPTDLPNLLLVCWAHHQLLHEGRWSVRGEPGPHVTWIRPDGEPFEPRVRVVLDTS